MTDIKKEEGWGKKDISTKGVVDRGEEGGRGGGGEGKEKSPLPAHD